MKIQKTILLLFIIPLFSFTAHKYYLSLTQVTFKPKAKAIQIIINVFIDDIEKALNKDYTIDLQLTSKNELSNNDVYFEKYLKDKLQFSIDDVPKEFTYLGKEYDGELVYFYLEIENIESVKNILVSNKILINHFPEQQNLIKTKVGSIAKSVLLTKNKTSAILKH